MTERPRIAAELDLWPHPEGGWYRETWRSAMSFRPAGYNGERNIATAIYFLLGPGEESAWHAVPSDELWLWHSGGPLALHLGGSGAQPDADRATTVLLGADISRGERPQAVVPGRIWQRATLTSTEPVLVSCVVAPGFDFSDFRLR